MSICKGITKRGKACTRIVRRGEYCHSHRPRRAVTASSRNTTEISSSSSPPNEQAFMRAATSYSKHVSQTLSQDTTQALGLLTLVLAADSENVAATNVANSISSFIQMMSKTKGKKKKVDLMLEFGAAIYLLTKATQPPSISTAVDIDGDPAVIIIDDEPPPPYTPREV